MNDSEELVGDASRGDRRAVDALLERHLPDLRRYVDQRAGRALLEKESASDLVQSVCAELFEGLRAERFEYRGELEFKQWLYGAALFKLQSRRRHWRTDMRDTAREIRVDADGSRDPGAADPVTRSTPSGAAIEREELTRLRSSLSELPEHYRAIIELAHVEGLSHKEIGERLSIEESHSRVLLTRALARLAVLATRGRG